mmetsp:Transcript_93497/g.250507  ORF Transcript_93497/g.250507 Transcript_93497/m.250507 type:complete len:203 (-) Transcript_93497:949-1557(-)
MCFRWVAIRVSSSARMVPIKRSWACANSSKSSAGESLTGGGSGAAGAAGGLLAGSKRSRGSRPSPEAFLAQVASARSAGRASGPSRRTTPSRAPRVPSALPRAEPTSAGVGVMLPPVEPSSAIRGETSSHRSGLRPRLGRAQDSCGGLTTLLGLLVSRGGTSSAAAIPSLGALAWSGPATRSAVVKAPSPPGASLRRSSLTR